MHRQPLRDLLCQYQKDQPGEAEIVDRFLAFIDANSDCLLRTCREGHITAAAWIVSVENPDSCLLTYHGKLRRWLQLGGHVDGEADVAKAALREAQEESGMERFEFHSSQPFDLDIHPIPARRDEPEHLHFDLRFLLRAKAGQSLAISDESLDLRWFQTDELVAATDEESVLRMARKAVGLSFGG